MRLIAWNANYNNRRRSFEADLALLAHLNGDADYAATGAGR